MSQRFFASVRRNQRQWMVVVTVLAMVSFLFLDNVSQRSGPMSPFGGGLLIGSLVAAGMCIVGYPRGKTVEFGAGGFVVGFLAGFLGFGAMGFNKPLARTSAGNYSRTDFIHLANQRKRINQFVFSLARKVQNSQVQGFGGADDGSLMSHEMLLADAKKMGIHISDKGVNDFLHQISLGKMTKADFKSALTEAGLGESEMFELLKKELSAQLVAELMVPPAYNPPIARGFERYVQESTRSLAQTPHQLWDAFQKLNLKESLQAVAIPVNDFISKAPEPTDTELAQFFDRYKFQRWVDEARPGFNRPPRVQLAYLTANLETFEKGEEPSDSDVSEYYEKNKERYRVTPGQATSTEGPASTDAAAGDAPKTDATKTEEPKPENPPAATETKPEQPAAGDAEAKPKEEPKPNADAPKEEKPAENPADKPAEGDKSQCGDEEPKKPEAKPEEPKPAAPAEAKPADPAAEVKPEAPAEAKPADAPKEEPKDAPPANPTVPALNASPETLPGPKYRDLNDELKLEIREAILRERAFAKISTELDKAYDVMVKLGLDYDTTTDKAKRPEKAAAIADQLREYAQAHKLEYKETPEWTYEELAAEPIGVSLDGNGRTPVSTEAFTTAGRGEQRLPPYAPRRSESKQQFESFAYWKIAFLPATVSDPKDETVRTRLIAAWKFDQARKIAEDRGKALLDKIKANNNDMPATLGTEPITGAEGSPVFKIIETEEFSWLTAGQAMPGQSQNPTVSTIPMIDNVGNPFMKMVFDELKDGEVGLVADDSRSTFYIVKVVNRDLAKDDGGVAKQEQHQKFMKEEFSSRLFPIIKTPYQTFAQLSQQQIDQAWRQSFEQQHSVVWDTSAREMPDEQE